MTRRPALRLVLALAGAAAATLAASPAAVADCARQAFRFGPNFPNSTSLWRVRAGEPCAGQLFPGQNTMLEGLAVERQAAHGVAAAGVGSKLHFAYNPSPGFVGRDQFVLRIDYDVKGVRGSTRVRVDIDVAAR